jgi:hypothetical protein
MGDLLRLRKPHPCGGYEWTVVRLGADIGLTCITCGRRVLLPRREVQRRLRHFVSRGPGYEAAQALIAEQEARVADVTVADDKPSAMKDQDTDGEG